MLRVFPTIRRRRLEAPDVNAFASQSSMWNGVGLGTGLECENVSPAADAEVAQPAAFAKEAASFGCVRILGAELGHELG
jgi:hypothetical protein